MRGNVIAVCVVGCLALGTITLRFPQRQKSLIKSATPARAQASTAETSPNVMTAVDGLSLSFEENRGQAGPDVMFLARGRGFDLLLTTTEAILTMRTADEAWQHSILDRLNPHAGVGQAPSARRNPQSAELRLRLIGADPPQQLSGMARLPGRSNYFLGNDRRRWLTDIPTFARVAYTQVYPGVDLVYYGSQHAMEYDFIVAPGGDPNRIRLAFEGADSIELDADGNLLIHSDGGVIHQRKPTIYQERGGDKREVAGNYVVHSANQVGFEVGAYDPREPLVIDPVLVYASQLGGGGSERAWDVAVDSSGSAYIVGATTSIDFAATDSLQQSSASVFVAKFDATGESLVYSTYLDGNANDIGHGIAVDQAGNAYVTGWTDSPNFPTANPLQATKSGGTDVFIAKLNATGNGLVYGTFLGGVNADLGNAIAVDALTNAYVTGSTESDNFPTLGGVQSVSKGNGDAFVAKLRADGSGLEYSTFLGGSAADAAAGIAVDAAGSAYIVGSTLSITFPTVNPYQGDYSGGFRDCFVAKLGPTGGSLSYSTYLGGSDWDEGQDIAVDATGSAYVTGFTRSLNFPLANPVQSGLAGNLDAFVTKLTPTGRQLAYSTYLGGVGVDVGSGIAVDTAGSAHVTGWTLSTNYPTVNPLQSRIANDVTFKTSDGAGTWIAINDGLASLDVRAVVVDPTNPQTLYAAAETGVFKSTDGGASWRATSNGMGSSGVNALAIDRSNPQTIYAGTSGGLFKSTTAGLSWSAPSSTLTGRNITAVTIDPTASQTVYVGTLDGGVFRSTDGGARWSGMSAGLPTSEVKAIVVDPATTTTLYAATATGGVFKRTSGGNNNWNGINTGLPTRFMRALAIDPSNPATLYLGTADSGIYETTDGGRRWTAINTGLTSLSIRALIVDVSSPATVYAAAYEGGVFKTVNGGDRWVAVNRGFTNLNTQGIALSPSSSSIVYAGAFAGSDAFVAKFNPEGSALVYSTYLGGGDDDVGVALEVDPAGNVYVTGSTESPNFPTATPKQSNFGGIRDAFLVKIADRNVPPRIVVTPRRLDFGSVTVGDSSELRLTVRNTGNAVLVISSIAADNPQFSVSSPTIPITLVGGGQQTITVRYAPSALGAQSGTLSIVSNDPENGTVLVEVTGTAEPTPYMLSAPETEGAAGTTVTVPIWLGEGGNISAMRFTLTFDPRVLSVPNPQAVSLGTLVPLNFALSANNSTPGQVTILIAPPLQTPIPTMQNGDGSVVTIAFQVAPQAAEGAVSPLRFSAASASDPSAQAIRLITLDGRFTVNNSAIKAFKK